MKSVRWWGVGLLLVVATVAAQAPRDLPKPTVPRHTPPPPTPPPKPGEMVFCVFGDTRPQGEPHRLQITSRLAAAMAQERPRVVLGAGDYIDGARDLRGSLLQLERFFRSLEPLQSLGAVPLAAALGNHDRALPADTLQRYFGPAYYSFDVEGCHFVVLDTEQPGQAGRIEGEQWQWLVADLQAARQARLIFVVLHQPLFPVDLYRGKSLDRTPLFRDRLHALFVQSGVTGVFAGHEHLYHRQERDGVHYIITGGGGAPLYAPGAKGGFHHYLRVGVTEEAYSVVVKRVD